MTVLDPITQAAIALQRRNEDGLSRPGAATIPVSFGRRVVQGFPIWVSQETAPATEPETVEGQLIHQRRAPPILAGATKATFAVALGYSLLPEEERVGTTIRRMWADGLLIYDATNPDGTPDFNGMTLSFHTGDSEAQPDAFIKSDMGEFTPGFRELIYVVLRDFPLQVGPTPVAPPPTTSAPVTTKSTATYALPSLSTPGTPGAFNGGLVDVGIGGWGFTYLTGPANIAYPVNGHGGVFLSWITDGQATAGIGGGYNSLTGKVTPYPFDLGGGQKIIGADGSYGAIVETSRTVPGVVTQAPAPAPTYRTTLPTITVELSDLISITPIIAEHDPINANDPPDSLGVLADWDTDTAYAWTNRPSDDPQSFLLHTYSVSQKLELQRFAPANQYTVFPGTPDAVQYESARVHFDYLCAHDKLNKFAFTIPFSTVTPNSDSIICIDLETGKILSGYGLHTFDTTDVPGVSIAQRQRGDCVVSTSSFGKSYGVVSSSALGPIFGYTTYTTTGILSHGGEVELGAPGFLGGNHPSTVLAYPIVDRPDLVAQYGMSPLMTQNWFAFVAMGTGLWLAQGDPDEIFGATQVYTSPVNIIASFIDQTDFSVMLVEAVGGQYYLEKIRVNYTFSDAGVTPSFGGSVYHVPINTPVNGVHFETSFRESNYLDGRLVYPGMDDGDPFWFTYDMSTGQRISAVAWPHSGANAESFVYNSRTGNALVMGIGPEPVNTQVTSSDTETIPLNDLLRWLMLEAGYSTEQIDISGDLDDAVIGGVYTSRLGLWPYIRNLAVVYNFSFYESEGKIKFTRGTSGDTTLVSYTIDVDSLSQVQSGGDVSENLITTMASPVELATSVEISYVDPDYGYQPNSKVFSRSRFPYKDSRGGQMASYATYLVMDSGEALQRAARVAFSNYGQGIVQAMRLPWAFSRMEPSDSIALTIAGRNYLVNVTEVVLNMDWSLSVTGVDFNYRNDVAVSADQPLGLINQPAGPSDSLPVIIDTTLPAATDDPGATTALLFTGVQSRGQPWWTGAALNILDGGWSQLYFTDEQVPYATCTLALAPTFVPFQTDSASYDMLSVTMPAGTIGTVSASQDDFLAGVNAAFVGNVGRWELIYFKDITWHNARAFTITGLLRGRRGTETHVNSHQVGDYFIPFNRPKLPKYTMSESRVGEEFSYAAVGKGTTKSAVVVDAPLEGNSLKPWAPHHVKAVENAGDIDITWLRRNRINESPLFVTDDVPMEEFVEAYEVDIVEAGVVVRTYTGLSTPEATYTAAHQTADGWTSTPIQLTLRVYQISDTIGRGLTNEVTVNVE